MLLPATRSSRHCAKDMHGVPPALTSGMNLAMSMGCVDRADDAARAIRLTQSYALAAYGLGLSALAPSASTNVLSLLYAMGDTPVTLRASASGIGWAAAAGRRRASLTT